MSEPYVVCVGLATQDTIFRVPVHPSPDDRVVASAHASAGGGPAATAAVTLARLGVRTFLVGQVGDDFAGSVMRADLEESGIDLTHFRTVEGTTSPQSSILVGSQGRAIVHYPGTIPKLELSDEVRDLCLGAAWVHVDHAGFGALRDLRREVQLSIDGGNPIEGLVFDGVQLYAPTDQQLLRLFPARGLEAALDAGADLVVMTRGKRGSVGMRRGGDLVEVPGHQVDAVSTLGAGDVFHGALLAAFVRGDELRDALAFANKAAALSCRGLDSRSAIPTLEELAAA